MKISPQVIVGLWLPDGCYYIPLQMACGPVQVGRGGSGLFPDHTRGARVSRRVAGEVYGLS